MSLRTLAILLLLAISACSDSGSAKDAAPAPAKDSSKPAAAALKLEPATIGEMKVQKFGNIYFAGQPSVNDLQQFQAAGVEKVINLRAEGENKDFDEAKTVLDLRMTYDNPGFGSPDALSDPIFRRVRDLLRNKGNQPVLLHCASANRVGAVWLAHRVLDDGVPYDQALQEAKTIGMKPAYEAKVKAYIESKPE